MCIYLGVQLPPPPPNQDLCSRNGYRGFLLLLQLVQGFRMCHFAFSQNTKHDQKS
nr:MAG TPA: hypothetical protein [Caudoviricetes sp.]